MEVADKNCPKRAFIKYKAKEQLRLALDNSESDEPLDEELFLAITATYFRAPKNQKFAYPCRTREEANEIANRIATELAGTYKQIKLRQKNLIIRQLNALL